MIEARGNKNRNEIIENTIGAVSTILAFFLRSVRSFPQTTHRTRIRRYPRLTRNSGLSLRKHNRLIIRLTRTNRGRSSFSLRCIYIEFHPCSREARGSCVGIVVALEFCGGPFFGPSRLPSALPEPLLPKYTRRQFPVSFLLLRRRNSSAATLKIFSKVETKPSGCPLIRKKTHISCHYYKAYIIYRGLSDLKRMSL